MSGAVKVPGGPDPRIQAELLDASRAAEAVKGTQVTTNPNLSNDFPVTAAARMPYDQVYDLKYKMAQGGDVGTNWVVPYTSEDANYQIAKVGQAEQASFDAWVSNKYDMTDPAQREMLRKIYPSYFTRREELIDANSKLSLKYAKARLNGFKDLSDLQLEYFIETGQIQLPTGVLWDPKPDVTQNKAAYEKAFNNVLSPIGAPWIANIDNRSDIRGDPTFKYPWDYESTNATTKFVTGGDGIFAGAPGRAAAITNIGNPNARNYTQGGVPLPI